MAANLFDMNGYTVGMNDPYSNSETPDCPFMYQSMMLEVNKKVYMEDGSLRLKHDKGYKKPVRELITNLITHLVIQ